MAIDGRTDAAIDTSTLLNFLRIGRADLLAAHPDYCFVVVDQVQDEVRQKGQGVPLEEALEGGYLSPDGPPAAVGIQELAIFASLPDIVLGAGERAAIAAAKARGLALAMDDKDAWRLGGLHCIGVPRLETVSIMVDLIVAGTLSVAEADLIKADWAANHKFRKPSFASFAELLPPSF